MIQEATYSASPERQTKEEKQPSPESLIREEKYPKNNDTSEFLEELSLREKLSSIGSFIDKKRSDSSMLISSSF